MMERLALEEGIIGLYDYEKEQEKIIMGLEKEWKEETKEEGIQKGIEQGIDLGRKETILNIVNNLHKLNISLEDISKSTGLSISEINNMIS